MLVMLWCILEACIWYLVEALVYDLGTSLVHDLRRILCAWCETYSWYMYEVHHLVILMHV
jgi:hypothetical protein